MPRNRVFQMEYIRKQLVLGACGPDPGIPTLLHVCQESREFTLTIFRLGFHPGDKFYWSPRLDTICLGLTFDYYSDEKLHDLKNERECNQLWHLGNKNLLSCTASCSSINSRGHQQLHLPTRECCQVHFEILTTENCSVYHER
jgi:hypothetical protein